MWFVSSLKGGGERGQGWRVEPAGQLQKGCKNVVKEFLTGGEEAAAAEPRAWREFVPVSFPVHAQHRLSHSYYVYFC